jgi:uncharacterized protein YuzE
MISREQILKQLPPFYNRRDILVNDQDVADIITGILTTHAQYGSQYDKIAPYFIGANNYQTGANIWHFLKNNVRYKVEPESSQMLKAPAAIVTGSINGRTNTSDCKNMSLFTGGVLAAINRAGGRINWCYRFASYKLWDKIPQHVFCVINPDTKNEIWIDAVLPTYNNKKQYHYKIDKQPNNMSLIALSGFLAGKKKKARQEKKQAKKATKQTKKAANKKKRQAFFKKLKEKTKKAGKLILKYNPATAASRNAFLLLTKVNSRSVATNLKKLKDRGNTEAQTMWTKLGGNVSALNNAIDTGAKKKRLGMIMGPKPIMTARKPQITNSGGQRSRTLVAMRTVRSPQGGTEAAITKFVPTVVAPVVPQQITPTGGGYGGGGGNSGGGGGGYSGYDDEPTEDIVATEEVDQDLLDNIDDDGNIMGSPAVTAGAIAAAAPIVALIVKILKKNKVSSPADDNNLLTDLSNAGLAAGQEAMSEIDKEAEGIETPTGNKILEGTKTQPTGSAGMKLPLMPILLVGGGLLAFTLLKKK